MSSYKKDINLLAALRRGEQRSRQMTIMLPIAVFLLLAVLILAISLWFAGSVGTLSAQRDQLQQYLDSERGGGADQQTDSLKSQADQMRAQAGEVSSNLLNLSSYPELYREQFAVVFSLAGEDVEISNIVYDRRSGVLSFSASSYSVLRMPGFVKGLRDSGLFADVQYQGYMLGGNLTAPSASGDGAVGGYLYELRCLVHAPTPTLPAVDGAGAGAGVDGNAAEGAGGGDSGGAAGSGAAEGGGN